MSQAEGVHGHLDGLQRVVIAFQKVAHREVAVRLLQQLQRVRRLVRQLGGRLVPAFAGHTQHVDHQHAVVGRHRPPALGDDVRMRHIGIPADGVDVRDHVVGVLLQGVIDAGVEVGLRTVVVDAQPAAHVQVLQPGAATVQIDIDSRRFDKGRLDLANVGHLAAKVKVQQLQTVGHAQLMQPIQTLAAPRSRSGRTWSGALRDDCQRPGTA